MAKKQTKKSYSPEFAAIALAAWEKGKAEGKSARAVAAGLGIGEKQLYYWKSKTDGKPWGAKAREVAARRAAAAAAAAPPPARAHAMTARRPTGANHLTETLALKREIETLREEVEILTKTVMVFARARR